MENIKYSLSGFLKQPEYSFHFYNFFKELEVLQSLEEVNVKLFEETVIGNFKPSNTKIEFSEDGNRCTIEIPFSLYYLSSNKFSSPPTPAEVFEGLQNIMASADAQHTDEF